MKDSQLDQDCRRRLERRLKSRIEDTYARSSVGGFLYLLGWLPLLIIVELPSRNPLICALITIGFLVAATLRRRLRPPRSADDQQLWINRYCAVAMISVVLWTLAQLHVLRDAEIAPLVKVASLFGTLAFTTMMAHTYTSMLRLAVTGMVLMIVPVAIQLWSDAQMRAPAVALSMFALYLSMAALHSRIDYTRRLDLAEAMRDQRDRFELLSRTDALTGLCNRRTFSETLNAQVREAKWLDGAGVALGLLDIDHFKLVNDRHGHVIGDEVLKHLARRLESAFGRDGIMVARTGGEEFGLIFRDTDEVVATVWMQEFRESLESQPIVCAGLTLPITASIGVGSFKAERDRDDDGLYGAVDVALYAAKQQGRNRVVAVSMLAPGSTERLGETSPVMSRRATDQ